MHSFELPTLVHAPLLVLPILPLRHNVPLVAILWFLHAVVVVVRVALVVEVYWQAPRVFLLTRVQEFLSMSSLFASLHFLQLT